MKSREVGVRGRERSVGGRVMREGGRRKGRGERGKRSLRFRKVFQFLGPPEINAASSSFLTIQI